MDIANASVPAVSYPDDKRTTRIVMSHWHPKYVRDPIEFQIIFDLSDF